MDVDFAPPLDYVEPTSLKREASLSEGQEKSKNDVFAGKGVRVDEKTGNARKGSQQVMAPEEEEYDPRKHRIHRGVRKTSIDWQGQGQKIGVPQGLKGRK